jgi:hypothetical protein
MVAASATHDDERRQRRTPLLWIIALIAAGAVVGLAALDTTRAAFSSQTGNGGNSFAAGTVALGDDDRGSILFDMTSMVPGSTETKCVNVTYVGVPANVRLYGAVTNDPAGAGSLAPYLTTTIEEGSGAVGEASLDCDGFTPTGPPTMLHGATAGSITLQDFADNVDFGTGLPAFGGVPTDGTPQARSYRITVLLEDDNAAQGKDANATFTWEAQNA